MLIKEFFPIEKWDFKTKSILQDLPSEDLETLMAHRSQQTYAKGEIIFREGAFPTGIFFIVEGKVKKYKLDEASRDQIIYVANTGELIGYHAVLAQDRYPDSAAALEKSKVAFIPKEDFLEALQRSQVLSRRLLKTLSHEFAVLVNSVSLISQKPVRDRLALQLVVLSEKYKEPLRPDSPAEINMSRDDLACLVGTVRENVVRVLREFKESGIIRTEGRKIIVEDVGQLIRIANYK